MLDNELVIIDYKMGNLRSVQKAFEAIGCKAIISNSLDTIRCATKLVLPGVGAFKDGMKNLKELELIDLIHEKVIVEQTPILGICLGMQLMARKSYEHGETEGLGWIDAEVVKFHVSSQNLKVPHVGWNEVHYKGCDRLFTNIKDNDDFYFVHSYYLKTYEDVVVGITDYGIRFTSAITKNNIFATQFHPEKSQTSGLQLLKNFLEY